MVCPPHPPTADNAGTALGGKRPPALLREEEYGGCAQFCRRQASRGGCTIAVEWPGAVAATEAVMVSILKFQHSLTPTRC